MGPGLPRIFFVENRPKIALNKYRYFGIVYHVYYVCIYMTKSCWIFWFECSVHVSEKFGWGWVGGVSSLQVVFFGFLEFFKLCKASNHNHLRYCIYFICETRFLHPTIKRTGSVRQGPCNMLYCAFKDFDGINITVEQLLANLSDFNGCLLR